MSTPGRCAGTAPHPAHNWGLGDYDCPGVPDIAHEHSRAPWTPREVTSLNDYQQSGAFHPFTCRHRGEPPHEGEAILLATPDGWVCTTCTYTQDWAHSWMADHRWRDWGIRELGR